MNTIELTNKRPVGSFFGYDATFAGFKFEVYAESDAAAQAYAENNLEKAMVHDVHFAMAPNTDRLLYTGATRGAAIEAAKALAATMVRK